VSAAAQTREVPRSRAEYAFFVLDCEYLEARKAAFDPVHRCVECCLQEKSAIEVAPPAGDRREGVRLAELINEIAGASPES
jgi:hypothetical protein